MPALPNVIFPIEPWTVTETNFSMATNARNETTFALSNGYIGTRGTQDEGMSMDIADGLEGNFINGFYESEKVRYGEWNFGFPTTSQSMLNVPNAKPLRLCIDGESFDLRTSQVSEYRRALHMDEGVVSRSLIWTTSQGKKIRIDSERFCSLSNKNLMAIRYRIFPLQCSGVLTLVSALEADVENHTRQTNPLVDYGPFGRRIDPVAIWSRDNAFFYQGVTQHTKLHMACGGVHCFSMPYALQSETEAMKVTQQYTLAFDAEKAIELQKFIIYTSDLDLPADRLEAFVTEQLQRCAEAGYAALREQQVRQVQAFWEGAGVSIDGDEAVQQGIRFNLYHIMQAAGKDGKTGMGAKGLTGEGYEGHYFWDTETYALPVFIYTQPELARKLLLYRYHTLPQARERARVLGHPKGALYPWRTINGAEASTYFPLGTAQYHINGDIGHAVWQFIEATGDLAFLRDHGCEMLCEIARVWADVGCYSDARQGQYCICSVTGPDEYNAIVDNNFYTNLLAQANLREALKALHILEDEMPEAARLLIARLQIAQEEREAWREIADRMYLPYDQKLGVYMQDDGFMMRKPWDDSRIPPEKRHLLYENYHPLFIYRQRMCKQADAILGLQLFSAQFSTEELRRNYDFYQSVTLHHSSLSTSIFGMLACRIGYAEEGYQAFAQSARMDLDDCHQNVYAGIHAANMAGTWQGIVQGFAGFRVNDGMPELCPILPAQWQGYCFHLRWRDALVSVEVNRTGLHLELQQGEGIVLRCRAEAPVTLKKGERYDEAIPSHIL